MPDTTDDDLYIRLANATAQTRRKTTMYDFSNAKPQTKKMLLASGIYHMKTDIRFGGVGPDGAYKLGKDGNRYLLEIGLVVLDEGEYKGTTFSIYPILGREDDGYDPSPALLQQIGWGEDTIRAIIDSHFGLAPEDRSDQANARRRFESYRDINDIDLWAQIGVKSSQEFGEQNKLIRVLVIGDKGYGGKPYGNGHDRTPRNSAPALAPKPPPENDFYSDDMPPF
ncbi:MAG TPA: hypothetical protein VKP67_00910 [Xanthobacteraceae bacterium]|nr:hypothetical protein [Xanthobacteraceae bacterium]